MYLACDQKIVSLAMADTPSLQGTPGRSSNMKRHPTKPRPCPFPHLQLTSCQVELKLCFQSSMAAGPRAPAEFPGQDLSPQMHKPFSFTEHRLQARTAAGGRPKACRSGAQRSPPASPPSSGNPAVGPPGRDQSGENPRPPPRARGRLHPAHLSLRPSRAQSSPPALPLTRGYTHFASSSHRAQVTRESRSCRILPRKNLGNRKNIPVAVRKWRMRSRGLRAPFPRVLQRALVVFPGPHYPEGTASSSGVEGSFEGFLL